MPAWARTSSSSHGSSAVNAGRGREVDRSGDRAPSDPRSDHPDWVRSRLRASGMVPGRCEGEHRAVRPVWRSDDGPARPKQAPAPQAGLSGRGEPDAGRLGARLGRDRRRRRSRRCAERPRGADRRCGLRQRGDVRRAGRNAELHANRAGGPAVQPLPRDGAVLADEGGASDGTQQPRGRLRVGGRVLDRVRRLYGVRSGRLSPRSRESCGTTGTRPRPSANGISRRMASRGRPDRLRAGPSAGDSTTSTGSSAAVPANGTRA